MKLGQTLGIVGLALIVSVGANAAMIKSNEAVVKVDAAGLDLKSERGQEIFYARVQRAAKQICGSSSVIQVGSVARAMSNRACYKETVSEVLHKFGLAMDANKTS